MLALDSLPARGSSDVEERIRAVMAEVLELEPGAIGRGFERADSPAWDSLHHLRLVTSLEAAFGIRFTMREVGELTNFETIREAVAGRL